MVSKNVTQATRGQSEAKSTEAGAGLFPGRNVFIKEGPRQIKLFLEVFFY